MDNYKDIKHLSRPQYDDLPPMPMSARAAQFSPFAALTGYDDAINETVRRTDSRTELSDDEINDLNSSLNLLLDVIDEQPTIKVTYFVPDEHKSGGKYIDKIGIVRIYDSYNNSFVFTDGKKIAVTDMCCVKFISHNFLSK